MIVIASAATYSATCNHLQRGVGWSDGISPFRLISSSSDDRGHPSLKSSINGLAYH